MQQDFEDPRRAAFARVIAELRTTYVHPADPRRDNDPMLAHYHAEAAREMHGAGLPHDASACGIPHRGTPEYAAKEAAYLAKAPADPVVWHFARYGNPGNGPFDMTPTTYRPAAEQDAANRLALGWASAEVVTAAVPPHGYHPGVFSEAGQKCARCDQLKGHPLHDFREPGYALARFTESQLLPGYGQASGLRCFMFTTAAVYAPTREAADAFADAHELRGPRAREYHAELS